MTDGSSKKILFPEDRITKSELIEYYERIAPMMLPHIENRPLMLQRCPDDIDHECFYQKNIATYFPKSIRRARVAKVGGHVTHAVVNDKESLSYLAGVATITPHMWLSRTPKLKNPDIMVFDLDPADDDFRVVREMAVALHDLLRELGLKSFPMTTGSRGVHVVTPLDGAANFDSIRAFAGDVAHGLMDAYPELVTTAQRKASRRGRLFIDVMRNAYAQTVVAPYSIRAIAGAPVATPLDWSEFEDSHLHSQRYSIRNIFRRLESRGDPWKSMWKQHQSLVDARRTLDSWIPAREWRAA